MRDYMRDLPTKEKGEGETPRPTMPPASYIAAGKKPQGARIEHCWLIFERGYRGRPQLDWLHRDRDLPGRGRSRRMPARCCWERRIGRSG
jgi:hypothetical protein